MNDIVINIAKDYTKTPGGRHISEGEFSGEDFRKKILEPKFKEFISSNGTMTVILDGGYGYAPSFLEEAFGGLARETKNAKIKDIIIVSEEEPSQITKIHEYISKALGEKIWKTKISDV